MYSRNPRGNQLKWNCKSGKPKKRNKKSETEKLYGVFFIVYPGDPGQKYSWYYTQKTWVDRLYLNTNIRYISAQ